MAEIDQFGMTTGIIITIVMILQLLLAAILMVKYSSTKDKRVLYFSLFIGFSSISFITISANFINILLTGEAINAFLFLLVAFGIGPVSILFWMILITDLMYQNKRKIILGIFLIYFIIFRVWFFYLLIFDIESLAWDIWPGRLKVGPYLQIMMITQLILIIITSILFFRESHRSDNKEVRLKGTLFLLGMLVLVGSMLLYSITLNPVFILILIIPALIILYNALTMPEFVKRKLLKERE